ncbi:hypothetical protein ACO2KH_17850 [Leptospira terpstrae]
MISLIKGDDTTILVNKSYFAIGVELSCDETEKYYLLNWSVIV